MTMFFIRDWGRKCRVSSCNWRSLGYGGGGREILVTEDAVSSATKDKRSWCDAGFSATVAGILNLIQ